MSKYRIRYISPEDQGKLKSWSDTLLEKKDKAPVHYHEAPIHSPDSILANIVKNDDADYNDNLLKKDTVYKKEDLVRMKILTKARQSFLKLENNKNLAFKLEVFNKKLRQKKLKAIVRAIKYYLHYD
jgi:hypothetical protein